MVSSNGASSSNVNLNALGTFNGVCGVSNVAWAVGNDGAIFKRDAATSIAVPGSVVIPRAASTLDLSLRTIDDPDLEELETITLTIAPAASYQTYASTTSATAWLRDNDNVNTLVVDTQVGTGGAISIAEGASTSPVKFYVSRSQYDIRGVGELQLRRHGDGRRRGLHRAEQRHDPGGRHGRGCARHHRERHGVRRHGDEILFRLRARCLRARPRRCDVYTHNNDSGGPTVGVPGAQLHRQRERDDREHPRDALFRASDTRDGRIPNEARSPRPISDTFSSRAGPYWVRVVKTGNSVAYFQSNDGVTWTQRGSTATISNLGSTNYLAGIAFAPGSTTQYMAVLDDFTVSDLSPGGSLGAETALSIGTVNGNSTVNSGVYTFTSSGNGLLTGSTRGQFPLRICPGLGELHRHRACGERHQRERKLPRGRDAARLDCHGLRSRLRARDQPHVRRLLLAATHEHEREFDEHRLHFAHPADVGAHGARGQRFHAVQLPR